MQLLDSITTRRMWKDHSLAPGLVRVPAGNFLMGGIPEDKFVTGVELPRHPVVVGSEFAIGETLVTRGEWRALMEAASGTSLGDEDYPVVNVSWHDVMAYLAALSDITGFLYRLPSEAEWEYACRAGSVSVFPQGADLRTADANFLYDERGEKVGSGTLTASRGFPPNGFGLHDMLGNACEWTADAWHPGYDGAPADALPWTNDGKPGCRTIRGGAWDHLPRVLRASWRDWAPETARWDNLGFRVARDLT